jgi:hypothetical protein
MANEFARNIQDASLNPVALALPSAASTTVTGAAVNLGTDTFKPENFAISVDVPALSDTILPSTRTMTIIVETSTTSVFTAVAREIHRKVLTGAGAGWVATVHNLRVPPDCEQYVRLKITSGASTTDASAVSALLTLRF